MANSLSPADKLLIQTALAVATRYESGGFENANPSELHMLETLKQHANHYKGETRRPLDRYEQWMVNQNMKYVQVEGLKVVVARLRANGYERVASAVEQQDESNGRRSAATAPIVP